jgi:hypothetical protein
MEFACSICHYTSDQKKNISRHINKVKSCGPGTKEIIEIPVDIECEYCNKKFATRKNLKEHKKTTCKQKDTAKDEEIKKLKEQLRKARTRDISTQKEDENYIYLIKIYPYEDNIYKIGRTSDIKARLASYKRYKIVFITSCENDVLCEKELIELYRSETAHCKEMGNEFFCGEYQTMKNIVQNYFAD